jgi:hypothetical protein
MWIPYEKTAINPGLGSSVAAAISTNFTDIEAALNEVDAESALRALHLTGKGTIVEQALTAAAGVCTLAAGYVAVIDRVFTVGELTQAYTAGILNYVYLTAGKVLRVAATNSEATGELLIATVDDSGGLATVSMSPAGKKYIRTYNERTIQVERVFFSDTRTFTAPVGTSFEYIMPISRLWEPAQYKLAKAIYFEVSAKISAGETGFIQLAKTADGLAFTGVADLEITNAADTLACRVRSANILPVLGETDISLVIGRRLATGSIGTLTIYSTRLIIELADWRAL